MTNISSGERSAIITYSGLIGDAAFCTLQGSVNEVGAGETQTIQLVGSCDPIGDEVEPLRFEMQVDAEF